MRIRFPYRAALLAALGGALAPLAGAACVGAGIGADAPAARFTVDAAGATVTDQATGLIWKRCSEGLSGANCASGAAASLSWQAALGTAGAGWRLPNRNELASLLERQCSNPAINASVFPGTPAQSFWSASPYARDGAWAWYVDFNAGDIFPLPKSQLKSVRLVRDPG